MSQQAARPSPAVVRPLSLDRAEHRSFLADVVIEHGPRDVLGRLFLSADTALREWGIRLTFVDLEELKAINRANSDSWRPLLPLYDPDVSDVDESNTFAFIGWDSSGRAVVSSAARFYRLGSKTLKEDIEELTVLYRDPAKSAWPGEAMHCTSQVAASTSGDIAFTGATWQLPSVRGKALQELTRPILRGMLYTRWKPGFIYSFMDKKLIDAGKANRSRFHVDMGVEMVNTPVLRGATINAGLVWLSGAEQVPRFSDYLEAISAVRNAQVNGGVLNGSTEQKAAG